jgi:hypothetical protein
MSRSLQVVLGGVGLLASAVLFGAGCSGDAKGGDDSEDRSSGDAGAGTDSASGGAGGATTGAGGSATTGAAGSATDSASGGSAPTAATYTAARACELFGRASCGKAAECGLVLAQTGSTLICAQCDALSLGIVQQQCLQQAPGDKDGAAVDRCVASLSAQSCAEACADLDTNECAVFGQLPVSTKALVCDPRCVQ